MTSRSSAAHTCHWPGCPVAMVGSRIEAALARGIAPRPPLGRMAALDVRVPVKVQTAAKPYSIPHGGLAIDAPAPHASTNGVLAKGERICLIAIAQHQVGVTRQQLTTLAGYRRSTRDLYVQQLARLGYVERQGDQLVATDAGRAAIGPDFEPLPTGSLLLEHWRIRLPEGERKLLEAAVALYPDAIDRAALGEEAGYKRSTRDLYLQALLRRKLLEAAGKQLRASPLLFDA